MRDGLVYFHIILISGLIFLPLFTIGYLAYEDKINENMRQKVCKEYGGTMTKNKPANCLYYGELYKFVNTYDGWKIPSLEKYVLRSNDK